MVGGEINHGVVDVLKKEYDLVHANVTFQDVAPADARRMVQSKEVSALLLVAPLTGKYLAFVRGLFADSQNASPVLIPIDSAGAIADAKGHWSLIFQRARCEGHPRSPRTM